MKFRKPYKYLLEIGVIVAVVFAVQQYQKRNLISGPAPAYRAEMINGGVFDSQDIQGKPYILHFWASWCPVCRHEQDNIQSLNRDYHVVTVAMQSGNRDEVRDFLQKNSLSFMTLLDEHGNLASKFGVTGVPTSLVVDSQGNITFTEVGYTTEAGLRLRMWLTE